MRIHFFITLLLLSVLNLFLIRSLDESSPFIVFLDVGQGDSVLIKTKAGEYVLIDGGPTRATLNSLSEYLPFYERVIDTVILTHPHNDHVGGLINVLWTYEVRQVILTGVAGGDPSYFELLNVIEKKNIPVTLVAGGVDFRNGGAIFDVIYPFSSITGAEFSNMNNASIVMKVFVGDLVVFTGGDIEREVEELLSDSGLDLGADIFKANHHGSKTSNTAEFIEKVNPEFAVISCGENNKFGHPNEEVLNVFREKGVGVYRTDMDGSVAFYSS